MKIHHAQFSPILAALFLSVSFFSIAEESPYTGIYKGTAEIYHEGWIDLNKDGKKDVYEDASRSINARVKDLLSKMTLEEKTCQMCTLYGYQRVLRDDLPTPAWKQAVWKDGIGAIDEHLNGFRGWGRPPQDNPYVWPAGKHAWAINEVQRFFIEETRMGIPVDFTNEGIRGIESFKASNFPTQLGMGQTWNKNLIFKMGQITGKEARLLGYSNVYAPILDVGRDQRWGRYEEVYGESPFLVAELGIQMTKGLQTDYQVASTAKHYCLYSNNKGAREGFSRVDPQFSPREGENIHLYPYKRVIKEAGLLGVMSSYNDYDGVPIQGSHYWLTERLRNDFGFQGYVVSDSDAVAYMHNKHKTAPTYKDAVRQSVLAGLNMRCTFRSPDSFILPLRELVNEGAVPMTQIDRMVRDILRVKFRVGLFDQPYQENLDAADQWVNCAEHNAIALQASHESLVLLKNADQILPLDRRKIKRIAVCGPNADDARYALTHYGPVAVEVSTVLKGLRDKVGSSIDVTYAKGCDIVDARWPESEILPEAPNATEQAEIDQAVAQANAADLAVVVVGGNGRTCGENKSRTSLNLPGHQLALVQAIHATGKPMVLVIISGRPLSVNWSNKHVPAIIQAFYPGSKGGEAIADVLFGDYNPGGKLSVTVPKCAGQIPMNFPCKPASQIPAGPAGVNSVLYPFGFGLSYTTFGYSNLKIEPAAIRPDGTVTVSFDITNTGTVAGDEIVQLYTRDLVSSITTYEKNLRGFDRVHLKPDETRHLSYTLNAQALQMLDLDMKWVVEPGEFKVMIASSSTQVRLEGLFAVAETAAKLASETARLDTINNNRSTALRRVLALKSAVKVTDSPKDILKAFDNNLKTWWSTPTKNVEMVLSMKDGAQPDQVEIAWYKGDERNYRFEIQRNAGGGQWVTCFKGESSGKTTELETYKFKADGVSEIKIIFMGNNKNSYSAVTGIKIPGFKGE